MAQTDTPALVEDGTWVHLETDERFGEDDARWADIDLDDVALEWTCPVCGETFVQPDGEDFEPAGWTSVHVPCATDEQLEEARTNEWRVESLINATPKY